ncbi:transcription cofactor HES-6-like isoform X1 [Entelurus aequoreus]|uniref:transcription cofactor HES-6-like isoform X1 n=1 Tax=Entelurus aequoreus TaxID=161455 RepID=UPI002B1CE9E3|nr:transcription cofactor HES-6-like isoform X1 [Entelurus aequoreus]
MAPSARLGKEEECKADRKVRKPLVEKKRRARINESLQELRGLLEDSDQLHSKMENAEVLEMTVKKVEDILKNRSQEADTLSHEASERFAAGYIQCMHEVHTFVSTCPGIDATVAAELLNHLLECMPLNEDHVQDVLTDLIADTSGSTWHGGGDPLCSILASPGGRSVSSSSPFSPAPSSASGEDMYSDLEDTDSEHNQSTAEALENREALGVPTITCPRSMWRPW